jgi:membrane associated rhomboid family serine protease
MFILPVTRNVPVKHTAGVVYGLILVNTSIYLATCTLSSTANIAQRYGFIPTNHTPLTVLTSMFLHGSLLHLLGNMFFLWMLGEYVENVLGHLLTVVAYLACGVCGAGLLFLADPHSKIPCIGASGAISGMIGMYMVLFPHAQMDLVFYFSWFRLGTVHTSARVAILAWLGEQSVLGLLVGVTGWRLGIAFLAHVGGLLAGAALGLAIIRLGIAPGYRRMIVKKAARHLRCPACRTPLPLVSPGHHNCPACGATFRVDEQREAAISDPTKKAPSWLLIAIFLLLLAGIGQPHFRAGQSRRSTVPVAGTKVRQLQRPWQPTSARRPNLPHSATQSRRPPRPPQDRGSQHRW